MQKNRIICGAVNSVVFGAITVLTFFNEKVNRLLAKPLGLLAYPIERLVGRLIKYNDSYLGVVLAVDLIYMLIIGFFIGFVFHKIIFRPKKKMTSCG